MQGKPVSPPTPLQAREMVEVYTVNGSPWLYLFSQAPENAEFPVKRGETTFGRTFDQWKALVGRTLTVDVPPEQRGLPE